MGLVLSGGAQGALLGPVPAEGGFHPNFEPRAVSKAVPCLNREISIKTTTQLGTLAPLVTPTTGNFPALRLRLV